MLVSYKKSTTLFLLLVAIGPFPFTESATAQVRVEAAVGNPFGVARITINLDAQVDRSIVETNGYSIESMDNRVFYPTYSSRRILGIVRQFFNPDGDVTPRSITAWFLFRGEAPFDITLRCPEEYRVRVQPRFQPRRHDRLIRDWWRQYATMAKTQIRTGDYPPIVETYLTTMLAQRLRLDMGQLPDSPASTELGYDLLGLAFNLESHRIATLRNRMLFGDGSSSRDYDLPPEIRWPESARVSADEKIEIEPIAFRVPAECFYIRFGSFANYLWLRDFIETNGGDLAQMITLRGHRSDLGKKLQAQFGLQETALGKILGGQVIADVALIGRDTYLQEGAAMGIVFEAKNGLLGNDLMKQRKNAVEEMKDRGATIEELTIGETTVSFASTPDNRLRSFYVVSDKFHLVTNSKHIVERFLDTAKGNHTLASSAEFRQMRRELPLAQDDTVFIHVSTAFFRGLLDWQYQIELRRRLHSNAGLQLTTMAKWAADSEGLPAHDIQSLVAAGVLPEHFRAVHVHKKIDGYWIDSNRGAKGYYLPIPDTKIEKITARELATLQGIQQWQATQWPDMDPITIAVKRYEIPDSDRERIRVSARLLPFDRDKYGKILSVVGPPTNTIIHTSPDDIIRLQMSFKGGRLLPSSGPHTLFFGMRDAHVPVDFGRSSLIRTLQVLQTAPAFLGAWPKPGLLDLFPILRRLGQNHNGITRFPFGLFRWESNGFSVLSFDHELLLDTIPNLQVATDQDEAQIRLFIGDVAKAKIHSWFHSLNYHRAFETSIGNTRLLHQMATQFNLPREHTRAMTEDLLGVTMTCALGGEYELVEGNGPVHWRSTNWPSSDVKGEFESRLAEWFRGMELRLVMLDHRVVADALLDVKKTPQIKLPLFNLDANPFWKKKQPPTNLSGDVPSDETLPPPEPLPMPSIKTP